MSKTPWPRAGARAHGAPLAACRRAFDLLAPLRAVSLLWLRPAAAPANRSSWCRMGCYSSLLPASVHVAAGWQLGRPACACWLGAPRSSDARALRPQPAPDSTRKVCLAAPRLTAGRVPQALASVQMLPAPLHHFTPQNRRARAGGAARLGWPPAPSQRAWRRWARPCPPAHTHARAAAPHHAQVDIHGQVVVDHRLQLPSLPQLVQPVLRSWRERRAQKDVGARTERGRGRPGASRRAPGLRNGSATPACARRAPAAAARAGANGSVTAGINLIIPSF